jgi:ParB-like chromosome segregation protein Spo0J
MRTARKEISIMKQVTTPPKSGSPKKQARAMATAPRVETQIWPIDKFVLYARNPRKNDAAVDRMCGSIFEFGFKIPCLVRSDGEVVDGHLRLKAARKLGITDIPVILCDEWTPVQVKAFRLLVNRSATWADWDEELLTLELQDLQTSNLDLALTGFDAKEIEDLLLTNIQAEDAVPPLPGHPVSRVGVATRPPSKNRQRWRTSSPTRQH